MNNKELIKLITDKVLDINLAGVHHAFVDISGHVNSITVRIYRNGWSEEVAELGPTYICHCYYNTEESAPYLNNMIIVADAYLRNDDEIINKYAAYEIKDVINDALKNL